MPMSGRLTRRRRPLALVHGVCNDTCDWMSRRAVAAERVLARKAPRQRSFEHKVSEVTSQIKQGLAWLCVAGMSWGYWVIVPNGGTHALIGNGMALVAAVAGVALIAVSLIRPNKR